MKRSTFPSAARWLTLVLVVSTLAVPHGQSTTPGEWTAWGGDLTSARYSALDQINARNFDKLEVAWRFKTDNLGARPEFAYEGTPLMVKGILYATAGSRRAVVALDAATGELLWVHSEREGARAAAAPRQLSGRGLSYWTDGTLERILYVTVGYRLVALDAKTGNRVSTFGEDGLVDLKLENDQVIDPNGGDIGLHATPLVTKDVVIVGAAFGTGANPKSPRAVKGFIRGYDIRTGKRLWIFHTIPQVGEFGNDSWKERSYEYTGNTGVWAQMSADEQLGLAYLPVESPTGDYFGGNRPGSNLFGESLVAVDLKTGARKWHYQFVHHPIWDMDLPCAPILVDIPMNGRIVKAIAQPSKQSYLYVLNRETGEPIWPIEEKPVERGNVPGEWYAPTQPFPTKPPAYERQNVSFDELIDFTPELRAEAVELVKKYTMGGLFNPPVVSKAEGPIAALTRSTSGTNWKGGSYDPENHVVYVSSTGNIGAYGLVPPPAGFSEMEYIAGNALTGARLTAGAGSAAGGGNANLAAQRGAGSAPAAGAGEAGGGGGGRLSVRGLPLGKPPYGSLTAIDLKKGEILWKTPHGDTPEVIKNHPDLRGLNIPNTGRPGTVGTLVTKTLLIAADASVGVQADGRRGAMLRAYDKATGARVGAVYMPAAEGGAPMTYMVNSEQYIVIAISGGAYSGELMAFKLPR
ncbi:MAG: pyrroloquinoline quinone-dependent dehydrogenase [Acidobacteria bacterium]|nr:pyrroloquinoline quinone-dependent dehydrogenase [Acidobacteriota bacterium]